MKFQHKIVLAFLFLLSFSITLNAQKQLNDYKYIVVPEQFSCQKKANDYQLNGLTQFLLQKQNFIVFLDSEDLPEDAANNGCLVVYADVTEDSSMFKTKLKISFRNCKNESVFTSEEGVSRDKIYKVAYNVALRNTIKTFQTFTHNYKEKTVAQNDVVQKDKPDTIVKSDVSTPNLLVNTTPNDVSSQVSGKEVYTADLISGSVVSYHLKNNSNTTVYTILYSGKEDVYFVKGSEAVVYKMNSQWVLAEYINDNLKVKNIEITF
ncbi:hypothetical protein [Olleya sp. HaHaR_3_96]|uniref:hypothetical protein n=1 Tax=Olleya sp. HaHaR_3_96 TaxID=2745560 RepID=UPI001C4F704E|nr:hypothetical protein [Olleya sp. HaHaR_3_96]QXP59888.1 hypothetical protein H0I26_18585 [Olleya sp. HaHaR_3_96]